MNIKSKLVAAFALAVFVLPGITFAQTAPTAPTVAQLQAQIAALVAMVQSLEAQLAALNGSHPATSITPTSTSPSITVVWPNGGEVLNDNGSGNLGTITWNSAGLGSLSVYIDLLDVSSGIPLKHIAANIPNTGSYVWAADPTIPNGNYKIRIGAGDEGFGATDNSNGFFQITGSPLGTAANPSLIVEVPQAGSGYAAGQGMYVAWNESGVTPQNVQIFLQDSVSGALTTLASLGASTASTWNGNTPINTPAGSNYVIIVCDEGIPSPATSGKPLCGHTPVFAISPQLAIVPNPGFISGNIVAGAVGAKIGSYILSAPNAEALQLKTVSINEGNNATNFQNFRVLVNGTQFGTTQPSFGSAPHGNFSGSTVISANGSATVDVFADVLSNASAGTQNTTAIYVYGDGQTTSAPYTSSGSQISGQTMTIARVGTATTTPVSSTGILTAAISANTPQASFLGMNVMGVNVAQYLFRADANGNDALTQLNITDVAPSGDHGTFINYRLTDTSGNVLSAAAETASGTLVFNLKGLNIPSNSTVYVNLVADVNSYPYAISGSQHGFSLNSFQYTNAAAAHSVQITTQTIGRIFTVYRNTLAVAGAGVPASSLTSISGVGTTVGAFTFTAGNGVINPTVKTVALSTNGSIIQSGTMQTLGLYDASAPSVLLASTTIVGTNSAVFSLAAINTNQWVIPSGSSRTLLVKTLVSPTGLVAIAPGSGNYQVFLRGVTWTDGTTANIPSLGPNNVMPIAGQLITGLSGASSTPVQVATSSLSIKSVSGLQSSYQAGQPISFVLNGIQLPSNSPADGPDGFNVQAYITTPGGLSNLTGENGSYNSATGLWNVTLIAPSAAGKYGLSVSLYCGGNPCSAQYPNGSYQVSQNFSIVVSPNAPASTIGPAPTVTLSANPMTITAGQSTTLTWSSTNATYCTTSGGSPSADGASWAGTGYPSQSVVQQPSLTTTYTVVCTGAGGTSNPSSVTVTVNPVVTIQKSTAYIIVPAGGQTFTQGASNVITWAGGTGTVSLDLYDQAMQNSLGVIGAAHPASGSYTWDAKTICRGYTDSVNSGCTNLAPGIYRIIPQDNFGGGSYSNTFVIAAPVGTYSAPTVTLSANPITITLGQSTTLTWTSANATMCTMSGVWTGSAIGASLNSSQSVTPVTVGANIYTMTCSGPGGTSAPASVTVTVNASVPATPVISSITGGPWTIGTVVKIGGSNFTSDSRIEIDKAGSQTPLVVFLPSSVGFSATTLQFSLPSSFTSSVVFGSTYQVSVINNSQYKSNSPTFTMIAAVPTVTLSANPTTITLGSSTTLTWSTTNATACTDTWAASAVVNSSQSIVPVKLGASTLTITCTGPGGTSAPASVTIQVNPAPVPVSKVGSCSNSSPSCQSQSACTNSGGCSVGGCGQSTCYVPTQYGGCGGTWVPGCNGIWTPPTTSMNTQAPASAAINQTAIVSQTLQGLLDQLSALLKSL